MKRDLAVITCKFNPCGYKKPVTNYFRFRDALVKQDIPIFTAELAFNDQEFSIPKDDTVYQFRSNSILWHKEGLLNALAKKLPKEYTKIAWVDADILFSDPDWYQIASSKLNSSKILQLFSRAAYANTGNLGMPSVIKEYWTANKDTEAWDDKKLAIMHPGFAWAARREFFELHGLFDKRIVGGGDVTSLHAFIGYLTQYKQYNYTLPFIEEINWYRRKVSKYVNKQIDYVDQLAYHMPHGSNENRRYIDRQKILDNFVPADVKYDEQGLLMWNSDKPELHELVYEYFVGRKEDE